MFLDIPPAGSGFNADDLYRASQRSVEKRLRDELPELRERAVHALLAHRQASKEFDAVKAEILKILKPDGLKLAMEVLGKLADEVTKVEAAKQTKEAAELKKMSASIPTGTSAQEPAQRPQQAQSGRK